MKLLKSESDFTEWLQQQDGWWECSPGMMVAFAPTAYPCYALAEQRSEISVPGFYSEEDCAVPEFLYLSDCEMMADELRKASQ